MASTQTERQLGRLIDRALPGVPAATARFLAETARVRNVEPDGTIFRQGELLPVTLIVHGYALFRRTTVDGQLLTIGVGGEGLMFGFSGMSSMQSNVDLVALTECVAAMWTGSELRRLAARDSDFALSVIDQQSRFVSQVTEKLDAFLHQGARRRVVRVLVRHRDLFFGDPPVLSRSELPSLVGTSREMTGRVLRQLEREGIVARVGRSGLKLLRPDRLDADVATAEASRAS